MGKEPLLDATVGTNSARSLTLYGRPNRRYAIQSTTGMSDSPFWSLERVVEMDDISEQIEGLPTTPSSILYRAAEIGSLAAPLRIHQEGAEDQSAERRLRERHRSWNLSRFNYPIDRTITTVCDASRSGFQERQRPSWTLNTRVACPNPPW